MGPATGRPTPWSADSGAVSLYLTRCTGSPWHSPCPSSTSPTSCSSLLCSFCSCFSPSSLEKEEKDLLLLHSHLQLICISCLPSSLHKNVFVVVLLPRKNGFVVCHRPQERFCGVLSPTRTIFVRGNHAPQGLLTPGQLTWFFLTLT